MRRHAASVFELGLQAQPALWSLVSYARAQLVAECAPDGFKVGVNDDVVAEQTVPHAHFQVVPRWSCDLPDPRGGVGGSASLH